MSEIITSWDRLYVLTGDECYLQDNWKKILPIGYYHDTGKNNAFLKSLHSLNNPVVLTCHGPRDFSDYEEIADSIGRIIPNRIKQ